MYQILIYSLLVLSTTVFYGRHKHVDNSREANPKPISHAIWNDLLRRHVKSDGFIDYKGFIRDSVEFKQYLALLSSAKPDSKEWTREDKMAFWINAYNAFTVKLVADNYPVASIKDIKRGIAFVNSVWDIKFIRIDGKTYDLNNIEHSILRPKYKDARVHAAINCASLSCPQLRKEAYTAEKLNAQLTDAMRSFVNDPLRNRVSTNKAEISAIFKWFGGDFNRDAGSVRAYINRYADKKLSPEGKISYLDYDWRLNESK